MCAWLVVALSACSADRAGVTPNPDLAPLADALSDSSAIDASTSVDLKAPALTCPPIAELVELTNLSELSGAFNRDQGLPRLLLLVSPG